MLHAEARLEHGSRNGGHTGMTAFQMVAARGDAEIVTTVVWPGSGVEVVVDVCGMRAVDHH